MPKTIIIADDSPTARTGLAHLINTNTDFKICAESKDKSQLLSAIERWKPDILVMDLNFRQGQGLRLVKN